MKAEIKIKIKITENKIISSRTHFELFLNIEFFYIYLDKYLISFIKYNNL